MLKTLSVSNRLLTHNSVFASNNRSFDWGDGKSHPDQQISFFHFWPTSNSPPRTSYFSPAD